MAVLSDVQLAHTILSETILRESDPSIGISLSAWLSATQIEQVEKVYLKRHFDMNTSIDADIARKQVEKQLILDLKAQYPTVTP